MGAEARDQNSLPGWGLWVLWVVASALGGLPGPLLALGTVGVLQWIVLRRYVDRDLSWLVATIAGFLVALIVAGLFSSATMLSRFPDADIRLFASPLGTEQAALSGDFTRQLLTVLVLTGGVFTGSGQWLVLRQRWSQSGWWIPASGIGWAAGHEIAARYFVFGQYVEPLATAFAGATTGVVMVFLLREYEVIRAPDVDSAVTTIIAEAARAEGKNDLADSLETGAGIESGEDGRVHDDTV